MTTILREPLTQALLGALEPTVDDAPASWEVGDALKPAAGGWQGDIGDSDFVPYVVLTPMDTGEIVSSAITGGFGAAGMVELPYAVTIVGVSRRQTELLADKVRYEHLSSLNGTVPAGQTLTVTSVLPSRIGRCQRVDHEHGAWYVQTDVVITRVSP